ACHGPLWTVLRRDDSLGLRAGTECRESAGHLEPWRRRAVGHDQVDVVAVAYGEPPAVRRPPVHYIVAGYDRFEIPSPALHHPERRLVPRHRPKRDPGPVGRPDRGLVPIPGGQAFCARSVEGYNPER